MDSLLLLSSCYPHFLVTHPGLSPLRIYTNSRTLPSYAPSPHPACRSVLDEVIRAATVTGTPGVTPPNKRSAPRRAQSVDLDVWAVEGVLMAHCGSNGAAARVAKPGASSRVRYLERTPAAPAAGGTWSAGGEGLAAPLLDRNGGGGGRWRDGGGGSMDGGGKSESEVESP